MTSLKIRLLLAAAAPLAWASTAYAQTPEAPAAAAPEAEETIIVTGSRLPNVGLNAAAPVTVLGAEDIQATGTQSVGELLRELPVATASVSDSAGRGNDGSANVALRGLSAVNTLVLVNGRRVLANTAGGTVDLNSIPFEAIERVEVLQDGASAVYGSDAIAGVVNVLTRRDFDGLLVKGGYGKSSRGDLPNRELSATFGQRYDDGGFVFNASYRKAGGNLISDRPISRDPDWRDRGGRNFRDPYPIRSTFTNLDPANPTRSLVIREGVTQARTLADFRPFIFPDTNTPLSSGNDGINYWDYESSASDISQKNLFFTGHQEVATGVTAFVEATFSNRTSFGFLAPDFFGDGQVTVSRLNDFNPFGRDLVVARSILEQPFDQIRQNSVESNTYRIVAGLEGSFGDSWKWDVSGNYQNLDQYTYAGRGVILNRLRRAAGDSTVCRATAGCVPINLFGDVGSITPEMLRSITAEHFRKIDANLKSVVGNVSGKLFDLPAGAVNLAVGAEYRTESFSQLQDSDTDYETQNPPFLPPTRKVSEVYAETSVPLLRDTPFFHSLDVDAAVRYSHYNAFGNTVNPKVGVKWRPVESLMIRGSWGTGFRAPNFTEANSTQTRGYRPLTDPCQGAGFAALSGCNNRRAPITTGAFVVTGGNPDLGPEKAKNLTVGFVYTPDFIPRMAITVDYYRITKSNIIGTADADYIIAQNAAGAAFLGDVIRGADNAITEVRATRDNLLSQSVKGIDIGVDYTTETGPLGQLNLRGDLTYLDSFKLSPAVNVAAVERSGTYTTAIGTLAKYRATGRATWSLDQLSASYAFRYVGPVRNDASLLVNGARLRADSHLQHDILVSYDFEKAKAKLSLGVENVFDNMPPFLEGNYFNGFDEKTFNSRGRYFYGRVEKRF